MRLLLSALFITASFIFCAALEDVSFVVNVLTPDLNAINAYHESIDKDLPAFIHWPHGIGFSVERDDSYLKIIGQFGIEGQTSTHENLYFKDEEFYFNDGNGDKQRLADLNAELSYKQPTDLNKAKPFLAIRYRSLEDVERSIEPFNTKHTTFLTSCRSHSYYLASSDDPSAPFLEYLSYGAQARTSKDTQYRALIGEVNEDKVRVYQSRFNEENQLLYYFTFRKGLRLTSLPAGVSYVGNVLGVRMEEDAFLAEVGEGGVKMLNMFDFVGKVDSPRGHVISMSALAEKVKSVEPRVVSLSEQNVEPCMSPRPDAVRFQVMGHVLLKKVNYLQDGSVDPKCPRTIQPERNGLQFEVEGVPVTLLCTDDQYLWTEANKEKDLQHRLDTLYDSVTLYYY